MAKSKVKDGVVSKAHRYSGKGTDPGLVLFKFSLTLFSFLEEINTTFVKAANYTK